LPIKKFFNTSGKIYKEMGLKDKIPQMTDEEIIELLSTDGMLVKRPLLIGDNKVLVGFNAAVWESINENK
jgi:arsenate reductase